MTTTGKEDNVALCRRAGSILRRLKKVYPGATTALNYSNPLELLVATVLSAQCTDGKVNQVTSGLYQRYRSADDYARADLRQLEQDIRPTGFFRNKAKHIQAACREIVERFGGEVPGRMEDLVTLPGVARKTANVVLGNAFGIASGVVVDTHVHRLAQRMGLSAQKEPGKVEQELMALYPKKDWIVLGHTLILHGRAICTALKPACPTCPVNALCPRIGVGPPAAAKKRRR